MAEDGGKDPFVDEIVERIEKLEEENERLRRKLEKVENNSQNTSSNLDQNISRRRFLKVLGLGAGGLAMSSAVSGLSWSKITPQSQGTSDIKSSTVADNAITSAKIDTDAVSKSKIKSGAVDTDQIASNAVSTTELSFNTATQTELDNHAGDVDAHHTKPTATQSASQVGGWVTPNHSGGNVHAEWVDGSTGDWRRFRPGETATLTLPGTAPNTADGVRVYFDDFLDNQADLDYTAKEGGTTVDTGTVPVTKGAWSNVGVAIQFDTLVLENNGSTDSGVAEYELHGVSLPKHSHDI